MSRNQVLIRILLSVAAVVLFLELGSSYVFYRYYAGKKTAFTPAGSATLGLIGKLGRKTDYSLALSADHLPVFGADPALGFIIHPGRYQIIEHNVDSSNVTSEHVFHLSVNSRGERITSYGDAQPSTHLYITGDSAFFGWGLNDEQTLPWLLQAKVPGRQVVNLTMNGYSTVQTMIQLQKLEPQPAADDVVILEYHTISDMFNGASDERLTQIATGFEIKLGEPGMSEKLIYPYGGLDEKGALVVRHLPLTCLKDGAPPQCRHAAPSADQVAKITEKAFDQILSQTKAHVVVAVLNSAADDPVVAHLRASGLDLIDLSRLNVPANDVMVIDGHQGPFWQFEAFERLFDDLQKLHLVN